MARAVLWKPLSGGLTQCRLCSHYCLVEPGARGECGVRFNKDGELQTFVGDLVAAVNIDPVEKKPLYHFHPSTTTLSFGTMGCNLSCSFCQNASLSQPPRRGEPVHGQRVTPESLVEAALTNGCKSISYTYSEPTIFADLVLACAPLAHARGLKNILVSNGFMSRELLELLAPLMDAANIDLKAFTEEFYQRQCGARLLPVLDNLRRIRSLGWWLEVTTLVIPGLNDSDDELGLLASFIAEELGREVPWHVSRFHPSYQLLDRPVTPVSRLEAALALGRAAGLDYVYVGNVPGHAGDDTYCPGCDEVAIKRTGFGVTYSSLRDGVCPCGRRVAGVGLEALDALELDRPPGW